MRDILFFDSMLTPKIIVFVYWLGLLSVVLGSLSRIFSGSILLGLVGLVFGLISIRILCELLIVLFKINENLQKMANKAE